MTSTMDERLSDELESLQAILMDDVLVKTNGGGAEVEVSILPATAADSSSQYVRVTLVANLPVGYPDVSPQVTLKNPRGLDESTIRLIETNIQSKIDSLLGEPVIFELIEVVREHLTESNLPSCPCVICLYGFNEQDEFVKTTCYHYFHSHCLWRHINTSERIFREEQEKLPAWQRTSIFQRLCPVCREVIPVDMESLSDAAPPVDRETARSFELDEDLRGLQQKMAALFHHQKSRGGIIDLEAEETKLLLVTETSEETPGPSDNRPRRLPETATRTEQQRRGAPGRGRGQRGSFSAARKSRGHLFTASR